MSQHMKFYCTALVGGFFLFSLLLKWQLWGNRLQLPLYVLSSPLIAVTMPAANKRWLINVVMTVLLLCSLPSLLKNDTRPLWREWSILTVERERLYFVNRSSLESDYLKVTDYFGKPGSCKNIGIYSTVDAYEYPFWILLSKRTDKMPRIEHIHVSNISGTIMLRDFQPCAVIELF